MDIRSVGLLVFEILNKIIQKDGPAIILFDLVNVVYGSCKFINHLPEVLMYLFGFFDAVLAVVDELVVKQHNFLQVQTPNLHRRFILHRQVLSNQVKLVRSHVHVLEITLVLVYLSL